MRVLNVLGAFLVLICNLAVSFSHTLALFRSGGFTGGLEYIAAVGVETTFIMGALNIVYSRLKGISPGAPAALGGLLGVLLVSWSNVSAGWNYGMTGILLGLSTPASLVVAEAILSRAILQRFASKATSLMENVFTTESGNRVERTENRSNAEHVSKMEKMEDHSDLKVTTKLEEVAKVTTNTNVEDTGDMETTNTASKVERGKKAETSTKTEKVENPSRVESRDQVVEAENSSNVEVPTKLETPRDWALFLYQQDGDLPGRKKLMEVAKCTEWEARRTLTELKKQLA